MSKELEQEYIDLTNQINEQLKIATDALKKAQALAYSKHKNNILQFKYARDFEDPKNISPDFKLPELLIDELESVIYQAGWSISSC